MIILYSSVIFTCFSVLFSIFITSQNRLLTKQKLNTYTNSVKQFQIFSDQYLLDKVYSILLSDLFKKDIYDDSFYTYNFHDFEKVLLLKNSLYNLHSNIDFIDSIDIYNKEFDIYISSTSGVFYDFTTSNYSHRKLINNSVLHAKFKDNSNQFWATPNSLASMVSSLSFVQFMPLFKAPQDCNIIFTINLNLDKVYNEFFAQINQERESYKIIDSTGKILFDTTPQNNFTSLDAYSLEKIISTNSGYEIISIDNQKYNLVWNSSSSNDLKYIYTVVYNDLFMTLFTSLGYIILSFGFIFIVGLLAIFIISKWLYRPLNQLVNLSKSKLRDSSIHNDLHIITDAFSSLNSKLNNLETLLDKNNILILNNIISDLINGKMSDLIELNERLKILNKQFVESGFYLLIIKFDEKSFSELNYEERELIPLAITELLKDYYLHKYNNAFKMVSLFNYEGYFTCLVNLDPQKYSQEIKDAEEILALLSTEFTASFNLALSDPIQEFIFFHDHYQDTLNYFHSRFIYGENNIFTQKLFESYEHSPVQINLEIIKNFETLLKTQRFNQLKEEITVLFNQIKISGYSYLYAYNLSFQFISIISSECIEQNIATESLSQHVLLEHFSKILDLNECLKWFFQIIDAFNKHIDIRNLNKDIAFIHDIQEHSQEHIDVNLCLVSASQPFCISNGY